MQDLTPGAPGAHQGLKPLQRVAELFVDREPESIALWSEGFSWLRDQQAGPPRRRGSRQRTLL